VVESTEVVLHLGSVQPAAQVKERSICHRGSSAIGHSTFDKKFQVETEAHGGPAALVSIPLANAHVAGKVPLWALRDQD
jgi:hypothetical protein